MIRAVQGPRLTDSKDSQTFRTDTQDIHCINNVWPFAWRPSLSVVYEPDLRGEVIAALFAVGVAVMLAITGVA